MIRAVLFDLDGVVRHFDHDPHVERRHGLPDGAIAAAAFASPLIEEVTTGRITRAEWITTVGETVGSTEAAAAFGATPFHVDSEVIALTQELRARGIRTAILTNGTDTIPDEIAQSGIGVHFDAIFNSAEIGYAKPDPRAFQHALDALNLAPHEVFFTDDSPGKLAGAASLGMPTHHFTSARSLRAVLRAAGLTVDTTDHTA